MKLRMRPKSPIKPRPSTRRTAVSFTAEELATLGRLLAAGQVMLQISAPVLSRLKAAMTRMHVTVPKGL